MDLSETILRVEQKRIALLQKMSSISDYANGEHISIQQAFESLYYPSQDRDTCLQVAKAYLLTSELAECTSLSQRTDRESCVPEWLSHVRVKPLLQREENLLRWMFTDVLEGDPSYFGIYAEELSGYFLHVTSLVKRLSGLRRRVKQDNVLHQLEQGQLCPDLNEQSEELLAKIKNNQPIVFVLSMLGLGDLFLFLPVLLDLADTFVLLALRCPIRVAVSKTAYAIVQSVLGVEPSIEVYHIEMEERETYIQHVLQLTHLENTSQGEARSSDEADEAMKQMHEKNGFVIVPMSRPGFYQQMKRRASAQQIVAESMDFLLTTAGEGEGSEQTGDGSTTFRRAAQRSLSQLLGIKLYHQRTRDDIHRISERLKDYVTASLGRSLPLQQELADLRKKEGFEQGYICVIEQGSGGTKRITARLFRFLLDELAEVCRQQRIGILLIKKQADGQEVREPLSRVAESTILPYHELLIREDPAYTLAFLQQARGVIGPDTFLVHAASYVPHLPVLSVFTVANSLIFRVHDEVIAVEHTIGKGIREEIGFCTYKEASMYASNFVHPLTIFSSDEEQRSVHVLIQAVQDLFLRRLREGVSVFKTRLLGVDGCTIMMEDQQEKDKTNAL